MTARGSDPGPGPDELRRRIYRPGATDDDRARYRAVTASQPVSSAAVAASADPPTKPPAHPLITRTARTARARSRRAGLLPAAAVAVAALAGIAMGLLPPAAGGPPASSPRAIAVDDSTRGEFVRNLATGDGAGIAAYLVTHGSPPQFGTAHRFYTIERSGTGRGSISLTEAPLETIAGRATVFLVLEVPGRGAWAALPARARTDHGSPVRAVAERNGDQRAGELTSATFRYPSGSRPVRLRIEAHAGVRWGVAVVFSD